MKTTTVARILVLTVAMLLSNAVQATQIERGQIDFTGNFTLNHNYNFNDRAAFPFGTLGIQTVQDATGIFAPYVVHGSTLGMNHQIMYGVITHSISMTWSIGGITFDTQETNIAGADFVGRCATFHRPLGTV